MSSCSSGVYRPRTRRLKLREAMSGRLSSSSVVRSCGRRFTQRLEGSRFGTCPAALANFVSRLIPLDRVKAGGSRELPHAMFRPELLLGDP
jgi:hypothetical protein